MGLDANSLARFVPLIDGVSALGIVTGTAKSFSWLDGMLNDRGRKAIAHWLMNAPEDASHDSWTNVFPSLIDRVFGPRVLSIKFFLRSCVASAIAILVVSVIMIRGIEGWDWDTARTEIPQLLIFSIGSNMLPDFCSLVLSRAVLRMMERWPTPGAITVLLGLDTALTGCIGLVSGNLGLFVMLIGTQNQVTLRQVLGNLLETEFLGEATLREAGLSGAMIISMRIFFFSAFFTSVWVWLYVVSGVLLKMIRRVGMVWRNVSPYLDIEKRPLKALGRIAGLLAGGAYGLLLGWERLFGH